MRVRRCVLWLVAAAAAVCRAWPTGAPADACRQMLPGHGFSAREASQMPYGVTTSNDTVIPGSRMTVTISRGEEPPFRGFFVQVRSADSAEDGEALGQFFTRSHSLVSCGTRQNNTISHSDNKGKEAVTLLWQAPAALDADAVVFRVTVVERHDTYWAPRDTAPLRVVRQTPPDDREEEGADPPPPPPPLAIEPQRQPETDTVDKTASDTTVAPPATASAAATAPPTVRTAGVTSEGAGGGAAAAASALATVYDSCLLSKGCFTRADACIEGRNCDLMVTYRRAPDGRYRFQLYGKHEQPGYLALGLSHDNKMGDDAVIYCTDDGKGGYQVLHALNEKGRKASAKQDAKAKSGELVADFASEYRDGVLLCEFTHAAQFAVADKEVDLTASDLHLMVASGTVSGERSPQYHHAQKRVSAAPVSLRSSQSAAAAGRLLFRLHGALMVAAWVGTASVGMLLARYYKQTWVGRQLNGLDLWFQGHRTLMVLTVLLTVGALVSIVLQLGGWTDTPLMGGAGSSPHPLLGILCVALAVLQPMMALCRCHPGTPQRSIFNWLHWSVGSAAHILGISAVFFAVKLPQAQLPGWTYWVLAAFVLFHVCVHLLLSFQTCWADRAQARQKGHPEAYNMRDMGHNGYNTYHVDRPQEAPGSTLRRTVLGVYIVINMLFVALLICMIVLAPADKWMDKLLA